MSDNRSVSIRSSHDTKSLIGIITFGLESNIYELIRYNSHNTDTSPTINGHRIAYSYVPIDEARLMWDHLVGNGYMRFDEEDDE